MELFVCPSGLDLQGALLLHNSVTGIRASELWHVTCFVERQGWFSAIAVLRQRPTRGDEKLHSPLEINWTTEFFSAKWQAANNRSNLRDIEYL